MQEFKKYIKKDSGFSLVEIVLAVGMMGAVSLGVMKLTNMQMDAAKSTKQNFERNLLMNDIRSLLGDAEVCAKNFGPTSGTALNPKVANSVTNLVDQDGNSVFELETSGEIYGDGTLSIVEMTFGAAPGAEANNTLLHFQDYGSTAKFGRATLLLKVKREKSKTKALKNFVVNITARLDASDKVTVCTASSIAGDGLWSQNAQGIHYADGNVGIGISDPDVELEINFGKNSATELKIINTDGGSDAKARLRLKNGNPAGSGGEAGGGLDLHGHNYSTYPYLQNKLQLWSADALDGVVISSTKLIQFTHGHDGKSKVHFDMVNGRVGIGEEFPLDLLHLNSTGSTIQRIDSTNNSAKTEVALYSGGSRKWELAQNPEWAAGSNNFTVYGDSSCSPSSAGCKQMNGFEINKSNGSMTVGFTSNSTEMNNPSPMDRISAAGNISARLLSGGNRTSSSRLMGKGTVELTGLNPHIDMERGYGTDYEVRLGQLPGTKGYGVWVNANAAPSFRVEEDGNAKFINDLEVEKNLKIKLDTVLEGKANILGDTTLAANLTVASNTVLAGTLAISGATTGPSFSTPSDIRLKQNIKPLENVLEKISKLRGIQYKLKKDTSEKRIGVIAQELQVDFPELVQVSADGMLSVRYGEISAVLIEAIKELKKENESKDEQIKIMKIALCEKDKSLSFCNVK